MTLALASQLSAPAGTPFHSRASFGMTDGMGKADVPDTKSADRHELVPILRLIGQGDRDALSTLYRRTSAKLSESAPASLEARPKQRTSCKTFL